MIPTDKLRWFQFHLGDPDARKHPNAIIAPQSTYAHAMVLQQWWTDTYGRGEWRDVPVEQDQQE